jgi:hypothetical protein
MNDLELKNLWKSQSAAPASNVDSEKLIVAVRQKTTKINRTLIWRDLREMVACVAIIIWYACKLGLHQSMLSLAGKIIVIASCLFIAGRMIYTYRRRPRSQIFSVRESLLVELDKINEQIHLLNTVLWWYALPITIGYLLDFWGRHAKTSARIVDFVVCALMVVFVHYINRYSAKKSLVPIKVELEQTLENISEMPLNNPENEKE